MNFRAQSSFSGLNLSVVEAAFNQAARLSVEQAAAIVLEEAEAIVPVDTGELRESGHVEMLVSEGPHPEAAVVFDTPYAAYVEYGTGERGAASPGAGEGPYTPGWPGMPAQPYLRPALDTAQSAIVEVFRDNAAIAAKTLGR
jgi:HK97 gp10 family phage protein